MDSLVLQNFSKNLPNMIQKRSQHGPKFNSRLVKNQTKIVQKYLGASWDVLVAWTRLGGVLELPWNIPGSLLRARKVPSKSSKNDNKTLPTWSKIQCKIHQKSSRNHSSEHLENVLGRPGSINSSLGRLGAICKRPGRVSRRQRIVLEASWCILGTS